MTNMEAVKECIRANAKHGKEYLNAELAIENAKTLAAIADTLERIAEAMEQKNETAPIMTFPTGTYRELMEALKDG